MNDPSPLIEIDVFVLTFVLASVVPLVVGFVTKLSAPSGVKAVVNVVLSVLTAMLSYAIASDGSFRVLAITAVGIEALLTSGVTYTNFWKPTGIAPAVQRSTSTFGVG